MGRGAGLVAQLGITLEEAKAFIRHYFERFAGVRAGSTRRSMRHAAGVRRDVIRAAALHP